MYLVLCSNRGVNLKNDQQNSRTQMYRPLLFMTFYYLIVAKKEALLSLKIDKKKPQIAPRFNRFRYIKIIVMFRFF